MKSFRAACVLFFLSLASVAFAQAPDGATLVGRWSGPGRLYEVKLHQAHGPIPFTLDIAEDLTLTGTVGGARIAAATPRHTANRIDYYAVLEGRVHPASELAKDHLVILITRVDDERLSADFHLKSRFRWDMSMHPGSLEARRRP
jgi:hypothetical protein